MNRCIISFALVLALSSIAHAQAAQPAANLRTISTNGEAVVYVVPDQAVVGAGVETFSASLDKSKAENDEASTKLVSAIKSLKIEDRDIQTDVASVEVRYAQSTHLQIEGYVVRRSYSITLKDTRQIEKLIDTLLKNGANQLSGVEFRTTELRKHRDAARKMAIKAAKEKAAALAGDLECKLAKPRTITEGYSGGYLRYSGANYMNNAQQVASAPGEAEGERTMPLGQIAIRASVAVTFDLDAQ